MKYSRSSLELIIKCSAILEDHHSIMEYLPIQCVNNSIRKLYKYHSSVTWLTLKLTQAVSLWVCYTDTVCSETIRKYMHSLILNVCSVKYSFIQEYTEAYQSMIVGEICKTTDYNLVGMCARFVRCNILFGTPNSLTCLAELYSELDMHSKTIDVVCDYISTTKSMYINTFLNITFDSARYFRVSSDPIEAIGSNWFGMFLYVLDTCEI